METHIYVAKNQAGAWHAAETTTDHSRWICDRGTWTDSELVGVVKGWKKQGREVVVSMTAADVERVRAASCACPGDCGCKSDHRPAPCGCKLHPRFA